MKKVKRRFSDEEAKIDLAKDAILSLSLKTDDDVVAEWEKTRKEILKFYSEEYVDILLRHAKMFNDMNKLSIALVQRQIFTPEELKQSKEALESTLRRMLEKASG